MVEEKQACARHSHSFCIVVFRRKNNLKWLPSSCTWDRRQYNLIRGLEMEIRITRMCTKTEQKFVIDLYIREQEIVATDLLLFWRSSKVRLGSVISFFQGLNASRIVVGIERLCYPDVSPRLSIRWWSTFDFQFLCILQNKDL